MSEQTWERDQYGLTLRLAMGVVLCVGWVEEMGGPRRWRWTLESTVFGGKQSRMATGDPCASEDAACEAGLAAAADLGKLITAISEGEARRTKRAAQDAEDAALVAAHGEVVWAVGLAGACDLHTATVAGHPCYLEDRGDQGVKWWLDPEYYGHPHTWYAPDLETAKIRAAAAAMRTPCKRWLVTLPDAPHNTGGSAEVWAVTSEGALYRAARALGWRRMDLAVKGNAMEVRL